MLTDEKKAMMLASFDVFRRPTPKMYRIQKSHDLAVHYWGLGVPLTHNSLKELWFKLYRERRAAVFNDRELSNLWRVIFTTVADGLLPLIDSPEALSIVVDALRERGKADKSEDFLRKWFDYYPGPGRVSLGGRNSMDALVASVPKVQPLAQNGFFSEGGPFRAANLLRKDENLSEGVVRVGAGFITAESRFTRYVWVERFPYYSDMIARGVHKTDDEMRAVLKFITDDSIDQGGKLRDPTMLVEFTDAMLGHFFKFPKMSRAPAFGRKSCGFSTACSARARIRSTPAGGTRLQGKSRNSSTSGKWGWSSKTCSTLLEMRLRVVARTTRIQLQPGTGPNAVNSGFATGEPDGSRNAGFMRLPQRAMRSSSSGSKTNILR